MFNLLDIFETIEQFAYNVLIWILIVPKTLAKIILDPAWVPGFITKELREKERKRFDDFFSPVILSLLVSVVPFVYFFYIARYPAVVLEGPPAAYVGEEVVMSAYADFISETAPFDYQWGADDVEPIRLTDLDEEGKLASITWETAGYKSIWVTATNGKREELYNNTYVYVGEADEDISGFGSYTSTDTSGGASGPDFTSTLTGSEAVLPALIFLGVPLLFALAVEAFRGNPLSGETLKRSFFIQCYYFSPVYLGLWAGYIAPDFFLAPSETTLRLVMQGIMVYFAVWLVFYETRLIAAERGIHWFAAFLITLFCAALVYFPLTRFGSVLENTEYTRLGLWGLFGGAALFLIVAGWIRSLVRGMRRRK